MTVEGMYHEESIEIDATAREVYDTVSQLSRMTGSSPTVLTEIWDVEQLPPTLAGLDAERLAGGARAVREGMITTLAAIRSTLQS